MTKKKRLVLFIFLVVLFLIISPLIIFYSLGWRFDWQTKKITQPGIFYFNVYPKNVQIYLDGVIKKKTDFFFGSVIIENLPPKKYDVEIKKEGFHSWKKTLEIKKLKATEAKDVILVPQNPIFAVISKKVEESFFSPDQKKIILKETFPTSPENSDSSNWALKLFELDKNIKSHLIEPNRIHSNSADINGNDANIKKEIHLNDLKFSLDSKMILLELKISIHSPVDSLTDETKREEKPIENKEEKLEYYILEIDKVPPTLFSLSFLGPNVKRVDFNPKDSQKLFTLTVSSEETEELVPENKNDSSDLHQEKTDKQTKTLSEIDLVDEKASSSVLENIIDYSITENAIYYLDASGFLFKTDFSLNWRDKLNTDPFPLKKDAEYKITASPFDVILIEDETLYVFDKKNNSFKKISEFVKDFKFAPDFKKIAYFNNYEIWVLFLEQKENQPQKETGDKLFLTRFSERIDKVFWYTNHYLIFNTEDKIKITEIDDRDRINIVDFAEFEKPEIFWNQDNKKLYILTDKNLYVSEKLTP